MRTESQAINKIFDVVKPLGAKLSAINGDTFERLISFKIEGIKYYIVWWKNVCYLSIGTRHSCQIPFVSMSQDTCWPMYKTGIKFTNDMGVDVCYLAINKLDWQKDFEKQEYIKCS